MGNSERVLPPDFGVEKGRRFGSKKRIHAARVTRNEKLAEWGNSGRVGSTGCVAKPADPSCPVIGGGVQEGGPPHGEVGPEARHVVEVKAEDGTPVSRAVFGNPAER